MSCARVFVSSKPVCGQVLYFLKNRDRLARLRAERGVNWSRRNRPARQRHLRFKHIAHRTRKISRRFGDHDQWFQVAACARHSWGAGVFWTVARDATKTTPRPRTRPAPAASASRRAFCGAGGTMKTRIAAHAEIKPQAGRRPKTEVSPVSNSAPRRRSVSRLHRS